MMIYGKETICVAVVLVLALTTAVAGATASYDVTPSFRGLGILSGMEHSRASGVSADGTVVTGRAGRPLRSQAIRWTQGTGMVGLGYTPGAIRSWGEAISADGSTVVGYGSDADGMALRWTAPTGMENLPLPEDWIYAKAYGVSGDGSVIVGGDGGTSDEAWRWTSGGGAVGLGFLPAYTRESVASGVSADGSVVVGLSLAGISYKAFRWTEPTGMIGLDDPPGVSKSWATAVSADGFTIVGQFTTPAEEAFRWTSDSGMVGLGVLEDHYGSSAQAVSDDGSIVVGYCNSNAGGETAFIWDADHGMRSLESVLVNDYGVDLGGWSLSNAKDVSADGRVIVGYGHNANRDSEAFLAQVPGPTPPIADADGPYTIWVGDPLILNAAQSTDPDPDGEIISYVWDLDGDGVFETNAGDQPFFVVDYEDVEDFGLTVGGMYDIHLQVTDNTGLTHTDSSSLRVIPEPAALSLLTLGGLALLRRRKRGMCK